MTITPQTHPKVYIAGPMTGLPNMGYDAFHAAAASLRHQGFSVISPAEADGGDQTLPYEHYMAQDVRWVSECDAVAVLSGWGASKGARLEAMIARTLKRPVVDAQTLMEMTTVMDIVVGETSVNAVPAKLCPMVALAGAARSGKDEAANALVVQGYCRYPFGVIIKRQLNALVRESLGFSAFTEDDAEKAQIRGLLEQWGEANYDSILREYFASMPERVVNTRLVRVREADEWTNRGGVIIEIQRPGYPPVTEWERDRLDELRASGLIGLTVRNSGTAAQLHGTLLEAVKDLS